MQTLLNEIEVSEKLKVSRPLLRKWRAEQIKLPFVKLGARVLYRESDIEQFLNESLIPTIN